MCHIYMTHRHRQEYSDSQREGGWVEVEVGTGRITGDGERLGTLGGGRTMQYADDVLLSCALEPCMVVLTNIIPINVIK